jgi:thiamine biosynthesis lipoprotein
MQALATRENLAVRAILRGGDALTEWISPALAALLIQV